MTTEDAGGVGPQDPQPGQEEPLADGPPPTEEELRAAYEQQIKQIRLEQIVLENVVTVLNLGMRKTGLSPGTEDERDPDQVQVAIESVRVQLPLIEQSLPNHARQIRDALSQLQMAYVRIGGQAAGPAPAGEPPQGQPSQSSPSGTEPAEAQPKPGEPGPAQRTGRLWVPGQ